MKTILTPEQSAELIKRGVSADKASMSNTTMQAAVDARGIVRIPRQPIFTLADLLSLLPKKITFGHRTNCRLKIQPIISSKDRCLYNPNKMKKKYRRAVCKSIIWLIKVRWIFVPIVLVAGIITFGWLESDTWDYKLERKFKVHDYDPD